MGSGSNIFTMILKLFTGLIKPGCSPYTFNNYSPKAKWIYNNYSMSPSWIWSDNITNERAARVGYNHCISNKGKWNNCFSKFSNRVLPPIFISTILQSIRKEKLSHYFPYDVKLGILADSRSFLANQKARNAIVGAENLLKMYIKSRKTTLDKNRQKSLHN